jgi:hypothetical protein
MIKGDYIEYEFDLLSIKGENVTDNFKKTMGNQLTTMGLNYEIYEMNDDGMKGGSAISTFPYNKFEQAVDTLLGKKRELSLNTKNIYKSLFSEFDGTLEEKYAHKLLEHVEKTDGYYGDSIDAAKKWLKNKESGNKVKNTTSMASEEISEEEKNSAEEISQDNKEEEEKDSVEEEEKDSTEEEEKDSTEEISQDNNEEEEKDSTEEVSQDNNEEEEKNSAEEVSQDNNEEEEKNSEEENTPIIKTTEESPKETVEEKTETIAPEESVPEKSEIVNEDANPEQGVQSEETKEKPIIVRVKLVVQNKGGILQFEKIKKGGRP